MAPSRPWFPLEEMQSPPSRGGEVMRCLGYPWAAAHAMARIALRHPPAAGPMFIIGRRRGKAIEWFAGRDGEVRWTADAADALRLDFKRARSIADRLDAEVIEWPEEVR